MEITFLGATQTVTGSKYLLNCDGRQFLIDCGLFQGIKELRLRNWQDIQCDPHKLDAVILTHAHIDHSGYLPVLMRQGFRGAIYSTYGTKDLCSVLLPDSARLQEEEAAFANKHGFSKHIPALPLYTEEEAENILKSFHCREFNQPFSPVENMKVIFRHAGHIIGASSVECHYKDKSILFSGDLGRMNDLVMHPPEELEGADYLVLESTYGDRLHAKEHPSKMLGEIINETIHRGGSVIIPAFAVGRAQSILYCLSILKNKNLIPEVPVYLDSPMAINATAIFCHYHNEHYLSREECQQFGNMATYINTPEQSKEIDNIKTPIIIISASGMLSGGRVLHHVKHFGTNPANTILLTGYQADGTRGGDLIEGKQKIKIHGEIVDIKACVKLLENMSAHADYDEVLEWLSSFKKHPKKVFITHGEKNSSYHLKSLIEKQYGWNCVVPDYLYHEKLI